MTVTKMIRRTRVEDNARVLLERYQRSRVTYYGPAHKYSGAERQAYANWRTAWLVECLAHLPDWAYKSDPHVVTARTDVSRHDPTPPVSRL